MAGTTDRTSSSTSGRELVEAAAGSRRSGNGSRSAVIAATSIAANLIQRFIRPLRDGQDDHRTVAAVYFTLERGKQFFPASPVNHIEDQQPRRLRHLRVRPCPACLFGHPMQERSDLGGGGLKRL